MSKDESLSIAQPVTDYRLNKLQWVGLVMAFVGLLGWTLGLMGAPIHSDLTSWMFLLNVLVGASIYGYGQYRGKIAGIKNDGVYHRSLTARGVLGILLGVILTTFYCLLYRAPAYLGLGENGAANTGLIALFDPISMAIKGAPANQWFMYGTIYTVLILGLGVKFIFKYRHNRYQVIRTLSVMAAQLFFAYLIPEILEALNFNSATDAQGNYQGWYDTDLKNTWPLDYDFFHDWHLDAMQAESYQPVGMLYLVWGIAFFLVVTPIITYFVGKRWYCSWICGCGGLAETAGDPFRHLSSKKMSAWKLERWLIHSVMVLVFVMTIATLYGYFTGSGTFLGLGIYEWFQKPYGFVIGAAFSGVIGVGFYPILGSRVWCRFGCPMAGYMGIIQRFKSRFRITTNGGQCISCGNCSTYCEQGIDVRAYAQKGENIVRASCVGCGVCAAVCPRGVLKLENGPEEGRINSNPLLITKEGVSLNPQDR